MSGIGIQYCISEIQTYEERPTHVSAKVTENVFDGWVGNVKALQYILKIKVNNDSSCHENKMTVY